MMASLQQAMQKGMPPDQAIQYVKSMATQGIAPLADLYAMMKQFERLKQQQVRPPQTPPTIRDQLNMMEQMQAQGGMPQQMPGGGPQMPQGGPPQGMPPQMPQQMPPQMAQGLGSMNAGAMENPSFAGGGIVAFQEGGPAEVDFSNMTDEQLAMLYEDKSVAVETRRAALGERLKRSGYTSPKELFGRYVDAVKAGIPTGPAIKFDMSGGAPEYMKDEQGRIRTPGMGGPVAYSLTEGIVPMQRPEAVAEQSAVPTDTTTNPYASPQAAGVAFDRQLNQAQQGVRQEIPPARPRTDTGTATTATNLANAANISTGTIPTARLASGIANATTFLRGDSTWSAPFIGIQSAGTPILTNATTLNFIGAGNTFSANGNTVNISIAGGGGSGQFNTGISSSVVYTPLGYETDAFTFPSTAGRRYVIESINVSNVAIGDTEVNIIASLVDTERAYIAYNVPIPSGGAIELLKQPIVAGPSDVIKVWATDYSYVGTGNGTQMYISYSTFDDVNYVVGVGATVSIATTDRTGIYTSTGSPTVLQSIHLANRTDSGDYPISVSITNGLTTTYLVKDLILPRYSTIELLDRPKRIETGAVVGVEVGQTSTIDVIVSGKKIAT